MGTTLTGTTPQDTYDSLIKVTDNGPLTGSLKVLTDGLGNDSALALSTGAASVTGTLAVSGNATFDTTTLVVDAANNRVGVGVASPDTTLVVGGVLTISGGAAAGAASSFITGLTGADRRNWLIKTEENVEGDFAVKCSTAAGGSAASGDTRLCILRSGNVGINTNAPAVKLDVVGDIRSSTGILFGADTAAANLLDDYEEGTWTMGVSFGGASAGVTTSDNTGTYTKIGRQVTVNGFLILTSKGSSTGGAKITGLPFTLGSGNSFYSAAAIRFGQVTFANQFQGFGVPNTTTLEFEEITEAGAVTSITNADFANDSNVIVSLTYFV